MLDPIRRSTHAAASAWRRSRLIAAAFRGATLALLGIAGTALVLEFSTGLRLDHLAPLASWLLLVPLFAFAAGRRPQVAAAASELDRRAGLADRLGTALEFAGSDHRLTPSQAADAAAHAPAAGIAALFPLPWRAGRPALAALLLALLSLGAGLAFDLQPSPEPTAAIDDFDDALAEIERQQERYVAEGNKEAVRLLSDLDRTLRRIRDNERKLRKALKKKRAPEPESADEEPEELEPPPPPPEQSDRITAADLERLEAETVQQLELTDEQQTAIVAELFQHSQQAKELAHQFHDLSHSEYEASQDAPNRNLHNDSRPDSNIANQLKAADAFANNNIARDQAMNNDDAGRENEDMIRRDLSDESQAEHDRSHDAAESFNQFLGDFVKDVQELVAEAATGKKKKPGKKGKKGKEVQVDPGGGTADKTDAMAETGFESMDDVKRHSDAAPSEPASGKAEGPPPEGMEATSSSGPVDGPAVKGEGDGTTSAGASGAGSSANSEGGLKTVLQGLNANQEARLEETLGQLREGALSDEAREAMFDRVVRHKVQAGLASERDDVLVDYFADAEELMLENAESLPPLFRDYAQSYFDAIRPGGGS